MTTANDFMESLRRKEPEVWDLMHDALDDERPARELPWLQDGAVITDAEGVLQMSPANPVRTIKAEMDCNFNYLREHAEASDCARRLTNMLGRPLIRMLQDLEPGDGEDELKARVHRTLELRVKDQLVDFAGHLWDVAPMETTDQFAERLMRARQDIEAATAQLAQA